MLLKVRRSVITTKKHRSGGKYTGSHTTVIGEAIPLLKLVEEHDDIKKISIGIIKNAGRPGSPLRVSIRPLDLDVHGLRITINKGGVHQVFRLYFSLGASIPDWTVRLEAFGQTNHGKRGKHVRAKRQKNRRKDY